MPQHAAAFVSTLAIALCLATSAAGLTYVDSPATAGTGAVVIDTRGGERCANGSLSGARCLSAADVLGPHDRLAGFADIAWVFGTAGLKGDETALVVGDNAVDRDFVAGLLYLMGQASVSVLRPLFDSQSSLIPNNAEPGETRSNTRVTVYQATARDRLVLFRSELAQLIADGKAPVIFDGRSEREYWGKWVRAARGGHLPGADHLPMRQLRNSISEGDPIQGLPPSPVIYGHGPKDGIAFFTLMRAGLGIDARVFAKGWRAWALDGSLPADSETVPDKVAARSAAGLESVGWIKITVAALGGTVAGALGLFLTMRKRA